VLVLQAPEIKVKVEFGEVERVLDHEQLAELVLLLSDPETGYWPYMPLAPAEDGGHEHVEARVAAVVQAHGDHPEGEVHLSLDSLDDVATSALMGST